MRRWKKGGTIKLIGLGLSLGAGAVSLIPVIETLEGKPMNWMFFCVSQAGFILGSIITIKWSDEYFIDIITRYTNTAKPTLEFQLNY